LRHDPRIDRFGLLRRIDRLEFPAVKLIRFVIVAALAVLAMVAYVGAAPAANAALQNKLDATLAALWTSVLETPSAQNSFGTGGPQFNCWNLGRTVAPFDPTAVESCTVKPGTEIFVVGHSSECSTFEGNGSTDTELRTCARNGDPTTPPTVSVDGSPVRVTEAETPLLEITLPADNIFGLPAGTQGLSVAHGWVMLLHPLTPGTHTIMISNGTSTITTKIIVAAT
jgi:hypothetical protein